MRPWRVSISPLASVDETNPDAVELYEFDSYEGDYYYAPTGGRLYKVSRDAIRLPAGFEGVVYFPSRPSCPLPAAYRIT